MENYVQKIRELFSQGDRKRDEQKKTPEDIVRNDDIIYGHVDEKYQCLDVYRPKGVTHPLPVIISVHGGGWVYGDKEVYQYYGMSLAQHGFVVVNYSYRLAPEHPYPACFEDLTLVLQWIKENHDQYQMDLNHLFAVGDSAGAHILSLYACCLTNPQYRKMVNFPVCQDLSFQAIALNCGVYNLEDNHLTNTQALMEALFPDRDIDQMKRLISADQYVTRQFPKTIVMTCYGDFLREDAKAMIKALQQHQVTHHVLMYGDQKKPLHHVFHCDVSLPIAQECNALECYIFHSWQNNE